MKPTKRFFGGKTSTSNDYFCYVVATYHDLFTTKTKAPNNHPNHLGPRGMWFKPSDKVVKANMRQFESNSFSSGPPRREELGIDHHNRRRKEGKTVTMLREHPATAEEGSEAQSTWPRHMQALYVMFLSNSCHEGWILEWKWCWEDAVTRKFLF